MYHHCACAPPHAFIGSIKSRSSCRRARLLAAQDGHRDVQHHHARHQARGQAQRPLRVADHRARRDRRRVHARQAHLACAARRSACYLADGGACRRGMGQPRNAPQPVHQPRRRGCTSCISNAGLARLAPVCTARPLPAAHLDGVAGARQRSGRTAHLQRAHGARQAARHHQHARADLGGAAIG